MEAKDFELPIEGSSSKFTLFYNILEEQPNPITIITKPEHKPVRSLQKNKKTISKKKK